MREIDSDVLKQAMHDLLGLPEGEKIEKIEPLRYRVTTHKTVQEWSGSGGWGGFYPSTKVTTYEVEVGKS